MMTLKVVRDSEEASSNSRTMEEASSNSRTMEEFEEEVLRKWTSQTIKDVEPVMLKSSEKRMDDIILLESTNISFNNLEECNIGDNVITDDFKPAQSSFLQDLLSEDPFYGPPAPPVSASVKRYPGFQHLFVYEPYHKRYDSLGPVEDLLDDLMTRAIQLSSSGASSTSDDPADYPLPDDSFGASSISDDPADYPLPDDSFEASFVTK